MNMAWGIQEEYGYCILPTDLPIPDVTNSAKFIKTFIPHNCENEKYCTITWSSQKPFTSPPVIDIYKPNTFYSLTWRTTYVDFMWEKDKNVEVTDFNKHIFKFTDEAQNDTRRIKGIAGDVIDNKGNPFNFQLSVSSISDREFTLSEEEWSLSLLAGKLLDTKFSSRVGIKLYCLVSWKPISQERITQLINNVVPK